MTKKKWPFYVNVGLISDYKLWYAWCRVNMTIENYYIDPFTDSDVIYFKNKEDAIAFKLIFG